MSIFERISDLIKANINDLIDRAEDPEKMVKQIIVDMEEQLVKSTQGLGNAMGSLNQVKKQLSTAKEQSEKWAKNAKIALEKGNEELAKEALANKVKQDQLVTNYQEMVDSMEKQVQEVRFQVEALKSKLEEARGKQAMLIARSKMADVKAKMSQSLGEMDSSSVFAKMDKMEEKVAQKEAQADAFSEISGVNTAEKDPFAKLEQEAAVDSELEKLKKELGMQ